MQLVYLPYSMNTRLLFLILLVASSFLLKAQDTAPSCKFDTIQYGSTVFYRCVQFTSKGISVATKRQYSFADFYTLNDKGSTVTVYEETVNQCGRNVTRNDSTIPNFNVIGLRKNYSSAQDIHIFLKNLSEHKELVNIGIEGKKHGNWSLVLDDVFQSNIKSISYAPIDTNITLNIDVQKPINETENYSEFRMRFVVGEKFSSYRFKDVMFYSDVFTLAAN